MSSRRSEAWIFVSHSVKDLHQVRRIRNEIESKGANPILFFLKQKVEDEQLKLFLRREIEARNFFILCDSENSRASDYVQLEVEHVQALPYVRRMTIDLAASWDEQVRRIDALLGDAQVFLSYAHADRADVQPYIDFLISEDFSVFDPSINISMGSSWQQVIQDAIAEAANHGSLVLFLTQRSLQSKFLEAEFNFYVNALGPMNPTRPPVLVALEPLAMLSLPTSFTQYPILDLASLPLGTACDQLKHALLA